MHFFLLATMLCAVAAAQTTQPATEPAVPRLKLWDTAPAIVPGHDTDADPTEPTVDIYLPSEPTGTGVVVLPGGGYTHLSTTREGSDIAHMLLKHNVAAFVVRYRHGPRYSNPIPFMDGQRAMRLVRSKAAEFKIDPHRIGVIGFSAGGHLAASLSTHFDAGDAKSADPIEQVSSRPDFTVLLYPVITFTQEAYVHKGSRQALAGKHPELWADLSPDQHVTHDTPPILIFHSSADPAVPVENSILFYQACRKNGVPVEMHLFAKGPHGFGLAATDVELHVWPDLMANWMARNKWIPAPAPANLTH